MGEAPGISEDALGFPFVGEAGKLADQLVAEAFRDGWKTHTKARPRWAFANIVACMPKEDGKIRTPTKKEADSCSHRLVQFVQMAEPRLVVTFGKTAEKFLAEPIQRYSVLHLIHPAAILRASGSDQTLKYRRALLNLTNYLTNVAKGFAR